MTLRLTGHLICKDESELALVQQYLPDHIRLSRAEPGCLAFDVTQTENPLIWQVDEEFTDQHAFDAHQTRTRSSLWYQKTGHITRRYIGT